MLPTLPRAQHRKKVAVGPPFRGVTSAITNAIRLAEGRTIVSYGGQILLIAGGLVLENGVWTVDGTLHCSDGKGGVTTMKTTRARALGLH